MWNEWLGFGDLYWAVAKSFVWERSPWSRLVIEMTRNWPESMGEVNPIGFTIADGAFPSLPLVMSTFTEPTLKEYVASAENASAF